MGVFYINTPKKSIIKTLASGKFQNALENYLEIGTKEKRSYNATFDENYYLDSDESVRMAMEQGHF